MKKKFRENFYKYLVILTIVLSVAGCEKKGNVTGGYILDVNEKANMQLWTSRYNKELETLAKRFSSEPRALGITIKVVNFLNDASLYEAMVKAMAQQKGPDMVFFDSDILSTDKELFRYLEAENPYLPLVAFRDTFLNAAQETLTEADKVYGLPLAIDTLGIFYNENYALDKLSGDAVPGKSWRSLANDITKLTTKDDDQIKISGMAFGTGQELSHLSEVIKNMAYQEGVNIFSNDGSRARFNSSDFKNIISYIASFSNPKGRYYSWDIQKNTIEDFVAGDVAMIFGKASTWQEIRKKISKTRKTISEKNIAVAFFPQSESENKIHTKKILAQVPSLLVTKSAKKPRAAFEFLKFLTQNKNVLYFSEKTGLPVARKDLIKQQETQEEITVFVRQAKFASGMLYPVKTSLLDNTLTQILKRTQTKNIAKITKEYTTTINQELSRQKQLSQQLQ